MATPDLARVASRVISSTNDYRRREGRADVVRNDKLTEAARQFADFMAKADRYSHDADGRQPWDRARRQGFEYCLISENIAYQYSSVGFDTAELASRFFKDWAASAGHRKNMLERGVTETGVAVARSPKTGRFYAVQMFGRPRGKSC